MGGGGGDGGYAAKQAEIEANKQKARDALNALFGMGSSSPETAAQMAGLKAPDRSQFFADASPGYVDHLAYDDRWMPGTEGKADQAGYDAAMADYNAKVGAKQSELANNGASREALYQTVRDNAYNAGKRRLDENQQDAARKLKFELFATGQAGGSGDIDQNARLKRTYTQGLMDLGAKADSAKADFHNADENARLGLLQAINAGTDQQSALSSAQNQLAINSEAAAARANGTAVDDLFNTGGEFWNQSQYARGRQAGQQQAFQMFPQIPGVRTAGSSTTGVTTRLPGE